MLMVALVAAAALGVASLTYYDLERTRRVSDEAQLRQLLRAGQVECERRLAAGDLPDGPITVELPDPMREHATLTVTVVARHDAKIDIRVASQWFDRHASQQLTYGQSGSNTWTLESATLFDRGES
ncbi:MAG: hypothetical protein QM770_24435 [Tepidisphaeraceae bacterium]